VPKSFEYPFLTIMWMSTNIIKVIANESLIEIKLQEFHWL